LPTPSIVERGPLEVLPKETFENFIYWTRRMSRGDIASIITNPVVMTFRMAQLIYAEWLTVCRYVPTRLEQIEWELQPLTSA